MNKFYFYQATLVYLHISASSGSNLFYVTHSLHTLFFFHGTIIYIYTYIAHTHTYIHHIHVNISLQYSTMRYDAMRWDAAQYIYIYAYSYSLYIQYIIHYTLYTLHLHSTFYVLHTHTHTHIHIHIHVYIWKTPPIFGCVPLSLGPWAGDSSMLPQTFDMLVLAYSPSSQTWEEMIQ